MDNSNMNAYNMKYTQTGNLNTKGYTRVHIYIMKFNEKCHNIKITDVWSNEDLNEYHKQILHRSLFIPYHKYKSIVHVIMHYEGGRGERDENLKDKCEHIQALIRSVEDAFDRTL